jgi:hypothetical protein
MAYYHVLILIPKNQTRHDYQTESVYVGENERLMQVKFFEAVRRAQQIPTAEFVVIRHDLGLMVKVKIEH